MPAAENASVLRLVEESHALELSGDVASAMERAQEALTKARSTGHPAEIAVALDALALMQFRLGHTGASRSLAEQALTIVAPNDPARIEALRLLGMSATETDDLIGGEDYYRQAIDLSRKVGDHAALARGLHDLAAGIYMPRGQFDLALAADAEALKLADAQGLPGLTRGALFLIAWIHWLTGDRARAATVLDQLRAMALPGSIIQGYYFCARANLALEAGDLEGAASQFAQARSIAEVTGEPGVSVLVRLGLSRWHRVRGDAATARAWANDALTVSSRSGYCHFQGLALIERGHSAWTSGDLDGAQLDLNAAINCLSPLGAAYDLARARLLLAVLLHERKRDGTLAAWKDAATAIQAGNYAFVFQQDRSLAYRFLAAGLNHPDAEVAARANILLTHLERVPPLPLDIVTLGTFEVRQANRLIAAHDWRQRRAGELFRLLLVSPGRSLSHEQIVEALWENRAPASTPALFHQATSALRRILEPELPDKFPSRYLSLLESLVTLHLPAGSRIDFEVFEAHVRHGEWQAACALYRGDLFAGDRYASWAAAPRERLIRLHLRALLASAQQDLQAGSAQAALDACRRILEIDPWQENAVLAGMQACLAMGDRANALHLYRELERVLREELGTVPQETLQDLFRSLLQVHR